MNYTNSSPQLQTFAISDLCYKYCLKFHSQNVHEQIANIWQHCFCFQFYQRCTCIALYIRKTNVDEKSKRYLLDFRLRGICLSILSARFDNCLRMSVEKSINDRIIDDVMTHLRGSLQADKSTLDFIQDTWRLKLDKLMTEEVNKFLSNRKDLNSRFIFID